MLGSSSAAAVPLPLQGEMVEGVMVEALKSGEVRAQCACSVRAAAATGAAVARYLLLYPLCCGDRVC